MSDELANAFLKDMRASSTKVLAIRSCGDPARAQSIEDIDVQIAACYRTYLALKKRRTILLDGDADEPAAPSSWRDHFSSLKFWRR